MPKRDNADEEHDYPEKDGSDGVRAPLTLVEAAEWGRCRLRHLRGTRCWKWRGRGVRGCMRGHWDLLRVFVRVCVRGLGDGLDATEDTRIVGVARKIETEGYLLVLPFGA